MKITKSLLLTLCLSSAHAMDDINLDIHQPFLKNQIGWVQYQAPNTSHYVVLPVVKLRKYTSLTIGNPDLLRSNYRHFAYVLPEQDDGDALPYPLLSDDSKEMIRVLKRLEENVDTERKLINRTKNIIDTITKK